MGIWWGAGRYDLPGTDVELPPEEQEAQRAERLDQQAAEKAIAPDEHEKNVVMVMRRDGLSRFKAEEFIEQGGLEAEQLKREMPHPMDEAIEKMKANGPPQWFIEAFQQMEADKAKAADGGEDSS